MRAQTIRLFLLAVVVAVTARGQAPQPQSLEEVLTARLSEFRTTPGSAQEALLLLMGERAGLLQQRTAAEVIRQTNDVRTDMQVGASSATPGSTTLIDRPGIPDLFAMALERGAISKSTTGSALTLTTTPYLLAGFFGIEDSPQNWEDWSGLRRVAISATFADASAVETDADFSSIEGGEVKVVLLGSRSPRDALIFRQQPAKDEIEKMGNADIEVNRVCGPVATLLNLGPVVNVFRAWLPTAPDRSPATVRAELERLLPAATLDDATKAKLSDCLGTVATAQNIAEASVAAIDKITKDYLAQNQKNQLSFSAAVRRDSTLSDFTTLKLLYAYDMNSKLTFNLNGEGVFNNDDAKGDGSKIDRVRSYAIEAGGTIGRFKQNRLDATFGAKIWRDQDSGGKTVVTASWKNTLYLSSTLQVPVSLTYANRAVANMQKGVQLNAGVGALVDHLLMSVMRP